MNTQTITLRKPDVLSGDECGSSLSVPTPPNESLMARSELRKCSCYHLIALVGAPLIAAVCLLIQLHKMPDSSLSYSLLNAIVSLLFNFSSSALLKAFSFLVSLLGFSTGFASRAR